MVQPVVTGVSFDQVTFSYLGARPVFESASFETRASEHIAVVGPNGSGKSTLLLLAARLLNPTSGRVAVAGGVSFAMQQFDRALLPWRSALGNAALGLELSGVPKVPREVNARESLETLELGHVVDVPVNRLSAGMRQRVQLARVLSDQAAVLLLDEPFSHLDSPLRSRVSSAFFEPARRNRQVIIWATHDLAEAVAFSDRILILDSGFEIRPNKRHASPSPAQKSFGDQISILAGRKYP